jgi:peptide/nickel transport system substrate-binding protein
MGSQRRRDGISLQAARRRDVPRRYTLQCRGSQVHLRPHRQSETQAQSAISALGPYKETEIVNDHEIIVRFNSGYAPFLDSLSGPNLVPVSPTAQQRVGNEDWGITEFVGTGPFKFESMVLNQEIVLVRNPDYNWGPAWMGQTGPANVEKLIYRFVEEPATRTAAPGDGRDRLHGPDA